MEILPGLKTCRKGLHQYNSNLRQCPECNKECIRRWREQNPERKKNLERRWREQNPEREKENKRHWSKQNVELTREYKRCWKERNPDKVRESSRRWRQENPDQKKEINRRWCEQNPEKINAYCAKHRAAKKQAIASWADFDAIKQIYVEAAELSKSTNIQHEVDHIYPLQSDYMCGLHVETNLQILTKSANVRKNNRTWPGQLDCQRLPISKVFTPEQIALAREQKAHF